MVPIGAAAKQIEIAGKLDRLENEINERLIRVERIIRRNEEGMQFLSDVLQCYKKRLCHKERRERQEATRSRISQKIRGDSELSYPHRKIIDALVERYDYQSNTFQKTHFTELVKAARIGRSRARTYLNLLLQKGYIVEQSDSYRTFFYINESLL